MANLPINFEAKLKDPKAIAAGYPYSIKAEHLMRDFVDAKLLVDESIHSSGMQLEEVSVIGELGYPARKIRIAPSSSGGGVGGSLHPFKITPNATNPAKVDIAAGTVYHETGSIVISAQTGITPLDVFLIKITRNAGTRVVSAAAADPYSLGFDAASTQTNQYLRIGSYSASTITQHWFHDVSVFEDLAVINGEFKLVPLAMIGANFYAIP